MKRVIILTIAGLITASLTAQTVKSPANEFEKRYLKRTVNCAKQHMITDYALRVIPSAPKKHSAPLMSSREIKQKLDSVIYESYDVNSEAWGIDMKSVYVYNAYGKLKTETGFYPGLNDKPWNIGKTEYFYDGNRNLIQVITSSWNNGSSQWVPSDKSEYTYNDDQRMTQVLYYSMNKQTNGWEYYYKKDFSLDDNSNLIFETGYLWDGNANDWYNFDKVEYTYDGNGNMIMDIYYIWSGTEWVPTNKEEFTYDNRNYLTMIVGYHWGVQWSNSTKVEYTYNDNGTIALAIEKRWDHQWVNWKKSEYTSEYNGDLTGLYGYFWDNSDEWYNDFRAEISYNDAWSRENMVLPVVYDEQYYYQMFGVFHGGYSWDLFFNHMQTNYISYQSETQNLWHPSSRDSYYYSEINLSAIAEEDPETDLSLFPNPAVDKFNIRYPEFKRGKMKVELYDLAGKKHFEKIIPAGNGDFAVDVSNLQNGLYFCRIQTEKGSVTKKLIIRK